MRLLSLIGTRGGIVAKKPSQCEHSGCAIYKLVYGRSPATTLDAMLPVGADEDLDVASYLERAEEARQLSCLLIKSQQTVDRCHYNLRRRHSEYQPSNLVWVWTPVQRRGLCEKLLQRYFGPYKVVRRCGELDCEVVPDG